MDGPDGFRTYWRDLRQQPRVFSKRNFGGGSVMVWSGFSDFGKLLLAIVSHKMNSLDYQNVLENHLRPYFRKFKSANLTFMQDNAAIHRSKSTKGWLQAANIPTLEWPAISPDLNPIENVWGMMVRDVYDNGQQYSNTKELETAILAAWDRVSMDYLTKLIKSMPKRMKEVFKTNGNIINY